jgi:class 3 adenylate cyclase
VEENLSILLADLSGYTALTETHGSLAAADLIDKYIGIVETCLVGDCRIHGRTGDEVMVVSSSPDSLIATAVLLESKTCSEENFLQVHGGLHYGKVLKRGDNYYGSAINLTARIAARANEGMFWCSEDFVNALSDKSLFALQPKGSYQFKNVSQPMAVYEIGLNKKEFFVDPVCRMLILDADKAIRDHDSNNLYFCSAHCHAIYHSNARSSVEYKVE